MGTKQLDVTGVIKGALCLYVSLTAVLAQGDRPACDIPPVEILDTAYITCYLPEEVIHNRSDFEVFHLRNVSSPGTPFRVLKATWCESKYAVNLQAGFIYDGSRDACSRIFTFRIPRVNNSHAGRYSCRPVGYDDADIKTCELVLKQSESEVSEGIATETCTYDHMYIINIWFLCMNIVFTTVLAIVGAKYSQKLISFRKKLKKHFRPDNKAEDGTPDGEKIPMAYATQDVSKTPLSELSPDSLSPVSLLSLWSPLRCFLSIIELDVDRMTSSLAELTPLQSKNVRSTQSTHISFISSFTSTSTCLHLE